MGVTPALVDDLTTLGDALDDPGTNLAAVCGVLNDSFTAAMPGFLGMTVMVHLDDNPFVISNVDPRRRVAIRASLHLALLPLGSATTTGSISFYSGAPGQFVDLADDVRWIFNLDGRPVLDGHLPTAPDPATVRSARGPPFVRRRRHDDSRPTGKRRRLA